MARRYSSRQVCNVCGVDQGSARARGAHEYRCGKQITRQMYVTSINFDYEHAKYLKRKNLTLTGFVRQALDKAILEEGSQNGRSSRSC